MRNVLLPFIYQIMDGLGLGAGIMGVLGGTELAKLISDNILAGNYRIFSTDKNVSGLSFTIPNFNLFYFEARCFNEFYFSGILSKRDTYIYVRYNQNSTDTIEWDGSVLKSSLGGQQYYFLAAIQ